MRRPNRRRRRRELIALVDIGANGLQPIFQAGRIRRNLEVMQARYNEALAGYRKAALNGVIRAQIPTALPLLIANIVLMRVLAFPS